MQGLNSRVRSEESCFRLVRFFIAISLLSLSACLAQREPVLKQIDLPHSYYYREMYLPQLTTGPSAVAWSPDSKSVVYSMAGSLWRQELGSAKAEQLTAAARDTTISRIGRRTDDGWSSPATIMMPSSCGRWICRTGRRGKLTSGGAVNVEPRFSPDGKRLAFVSTSYKGHFHIFVGAFHEGTPRRRASNLLQSMSATLPRYYYSKVDHEISPVWTRDGSEILFISNRGHIHGTGGFWRMKAEPGAEAREIHYEETNWKARPDFSPDGKRMVYASYSGTELASTVADARLRAAMPFPISYGAYDNINPRWSPDGTKIAFISNRNGNTSLWVQTIPGGEQTRSRCARAEVSEADGAIGAAGSRCSRKACGGAGVCHGRQMGSPMLRTTRGCRPTTALTARSVRLKRTTSTPTGTSEMTVPVGRSAGRRDARIRIRLSSSDKWRSSRARRRSSQFSCSSTIPYEPAEWVSGDVHTHMNYAGTYAILPRICVEQAAAENLAIVEDLVVNKEQRIPDIAYFSPKLDVASTLNQLLLHGQEFHTSYWGHLGLLTSDAEFHSSGICGISQHGGGQSVSGERECCRHGARAGTRWWDMCIRSIAFRIQPKRKL